MRFVIQMFTLGCSPETCIFTGFSPPGGSARVGGETIFGEIVPQRDRGLLAQPPLLALRLPSSFFSTHGLATFVTDVARPSAHNPKTKPTKATNTRWNFTSRNCSAICFPFVCRGIWPSLGGHLWWQNWEWILNHSPTPLLPALHWTSDVARK